MIVIDTNVISEFFKTEPEVQIMAWLSSQPLMNLFVSTPTLMELWSGAFRLPEGRKRQSLELKIRHHADVVFSGRVLELNMQAAKIGGELMARQFLSGSQPNAVDCQIAAIAISKGFKVATRNLKHFQHEGLVVINPWEMG